MMNRLVVVFILLGAVLQVNAQKMHILKANNGFWIMENNDRILFFQRKLNDSIPEYARNNYFHPVYDLSGNCITEDYPADHLHHRGIFWAWHQILVDGKPVCDAWDIKNFSQNISQIEFSGDLERNGVLKYTSFWHTNDKPDDPFIQEKTTVTVHPREASYRQIDFTISLRALENNLSIGGSTDEKGYGGFTVRLKTSDKTQFTDPDNKKITPTNLALKSGKWVDIYNPDMKSGLVIIPWPQNPGKENEWILRQTGSAQNCKWPGRYAIPLEIEEPVTLRYTLIIHKGNRKKVPVDKIYHEIEGR